MIKLHAKAGKDEIVLEDIDIQRMKEQIE